MEKVESADNLFVFWAKLLRGRVTPETAQTFHPLLCHMTDVAEVTRLMWRETLSPAARRRAQAALNLPDEEAAERWIVFFAGLHDLGKAGPVFTLQEAASRLSQFYQGLPGPPLRAADAYHGIVTAAELPEILAGEDFRLPLEVARRVAAAVGGHHGTIPTSDQVSKAADAAGGIKWKRIRTRIARAVADALEVPRALVPRTLDNAAAMWLAGLVSVADWIGSDERFFEYRVRRFNDLGRLDLTEYRAHAATQARLALSQLGWLGWQPRNVQASFATLFPHIAAPRPLQKAAVELAEELSQGGPGMVIIEAPMGEGKTEAALYLADVWGITPGARGCYVALPTQATSNQMYLRVRDFLRERYEGVNVNLQLLHGHAALSAEFALSRRQRDQWPKAQPHEEGTSAAKASEADESETAHLVAEGEAVQPEAVYDDDRAHASRACDVVAAEWFTYRKRGLLAPFGVGTVDQSLLAALQTRHVFVRLFGLAHKTIVVDEVHAYDAYMSQLLDRLLEWLAALGSPVVLLSATLPHRRRQELLAAYARGLNVPPREVGEAGYPRISWLTAESCGARSFAASPQFTRAVVVEWVNGVLPPELGGMFELGERLYDALAAGGCAAIICNTVRRAQEVYRHLKAFFAAHGTNNAGCELDLFHARYLFRDRDERERRQLARFGQPQRVGEADDSGAPESSSVGDAHLTRPHRAILVATQVIEQSLDLDFDLMVTEMAPADLVLQRAGRLHRHDRSDRPPLVAQPVLWIMRPEVSGDVPAFDRGSQTVYDPHILLRSWLALRGRAALNIPDEVEQLIEAVYGEHAALPEDASEELRGLWAQTATVMHEWRDNIKLKAKGALILAPDDPNLLGDWSLRLEEDNPEAHQRLQALTRLAEPSVPVVCLRAAEAQTFNPSHTPDLQAARELLRSSVTLSDRRIVFALLAQEPPAGWQRSPLLRSHRLVTLDANDSWLCGKHRLRLDPELGITIHNAREAS